MKQLGLAVLNYESAKKLLPPANTPNDTTAFKTGACDGTTGTATVSNGLKHHSLFSFILPYIEQQSIYDQIDFKYDWCDNTNTTSKGYKNNDVVSKYIVDFLCPSAENRPNTFTTDYNLIERIDTDSYCTQVEDKGLAKSKRAVDKLVGMLPMYRLRFAR
jgi:hypothetical protein